MKSETHESDESHAVAESKREPERPVSFVRRVWKWTVRIVCTIICALVGYLLCVAIGLIPVNRDFEAAKVGVTIFVYSDSVHSDVIVPAANEIIDWREHFPAEHFSAGHRGHKHVAIGWGDRGFFLKTPRWEDLKLSVAANAILLPSETVLHVRFVNARASNERRAVTISTEQYRRLVDFMLASFEKKEGKVQPIDKSFCYGQFDAFYDANGSYHAFNTCNCWVGRALKHAGVKVPWFSPLPRTVLRYLPDRVDAK